MTRAALYARVSTDRALNSDQRRQEVENQLPAMREFVTLRGWNLKREFCDRTTASGKKVREQFDEMIAACERREFDVLVIWALDRFSREGPLKTMLLLDRLTRCGVKVKSLKEPWLEPDSPTYELLLPIFAWIAKQESLRIGERVKAGIERARAQGKKFGRPHAVADTQKLKALRAQGYSWREIGKAVELPESTVRKLMKSAGRARTKPIENHAQK